jgi:ribonuclease HI
MELSKNVIDFEKRSAIKSQVLVDFIAGWTESANYTKCPIPESPWQVYCNRAWGNAGAGAMAILISPSRIKQTSAQTILLSTKQCYWGFGNCEPWGVQNYIIKTDSKVIVTQIKKECIARDNTLEKYLTLIRRMENYFRRFLVEHIDRNKNAEAGELANATVRKTMLPLDVFIQTIEDSSVKTIELELRMVNAIQGKNWRASIMTYLYHHYELENNTELLRM